MTTCEPVSPIAEHAVGRTEPAVARARRTRHLPTLALALVTTLAFVTTLTIAGSAQAANPRETEAAKLFFAGQYPEALKIYVDLAVATGDPAYMCEIGRCYSRMSKPEEASRNLRDCLSQATLTPKKKKEFQALQTEVEAARVANTPPPSIPTVPLPPAQTAVVQAPPPGWGPPGGAGGYPQGAPPPGYGPAPGQPQGQPGYPGAPQAQGGYPQGPPPQGVPGAPPPGWGPPPGQQPLPQAGAPGAGGPAADNQLAAGSQAPSGEGGGTWMTPVAYIAGSVGVLSAAGGVVAGLMAKSKFDEVAKEYNDAKYKNGKTLNTIQYVGYGLGAVGIGTAITLFLLAPSSSESHAQGGLHLLASPDSIGLGGTF